MAHPSEALDAVQARNTLREAQDRALHREGIPMFAVLVDERGSGGIPQVTAEATDRGAERTAAVLARVQQYRTALAPTRRDSDMGVLISVLAVAAYEDFDRSVTR
ncbi:hypothetical protein [Nakamurella sp. PAMC28650]|jgi:hypothetical protein|uniref:hypothetical protein n=1 Tax=Nakamurella sp. PAMC28650 TaxID=2762325 RepID=UPI00164EBD60|nr:hypothetical protein [Nakamurella sp. PAMC28650]QNK79454.1 hypothetical protein H7F38_14210 [Nakamurella sp. PAMC28650]